MVRVVLKKCRTASGPTTGSSAADRLKATSGVQAAEKPSKVGREMIASHWSPGVSATIGSSSHLELPGTPACTCGRPIASSERLPHRPLAARAARGAEGAAWADFSGVAGKVPGMQPAQAEGLARLLVGPLFERVALPGG